jgi:hypothetical protein
MASKRKVRDPGQHHRQRQCMPTEEKSMRHFNLGYPSMFQDSDLKCCTCNIAHTVRRQAGHTKGCPGQRSLPGTEACTIMCHPILELGKRPGRTSPRSLSALTLAREVDGRKVAPSRWSPLPGEYKICVPYAPLPHMTVTRTWARTDGFPSGYPSIASLETATRQLVARAICCSAKHGTDSRV